MNNVFPIIQCLNYIIADFFKITSLCLLFSGIIRLRDGFHDRYPVNDYLDLFDLAAHQIQNVLQRDSENSYEKRSNIIIGTETVT